MDYRTLTSGGLLRLAKEKGMSLPEQEAAYTEFSEQIFAVYTGGGSPRHLHFTLAFAEAELCAVSQYAGGRASPCVEKALSLVRHLLLHPLQRRKERRHSCRCPAHAVDGQPLRLRGDGVRTGLAEVHQRRRDGRDRAAAGLRQAVRPEAEGQAMLQRMQEDEERERMRKR